jgi:L-iditol 2-dehydrogenase
VIDPSDRRRELALSLGAESAVAPGDAPALAGLSGTADVVVEASGSPLAQAAALESAAQHGRVLMMGVSKPRAVPAMLGLVQQRDLTVFSSTGAPPDAWAPSLRMLERLKLDLQPLVSATFPFTQIDVALARAADPGRETKVLVHP